MNAVIYARYSSDNQSEESIQAQLRACREYAERNNINIVHEYCDRAQSARSDRRVEFQKMIADSKKKGFSAVIVHKLDRFSRDRYDHAIYRKKLRDNGVALISVLENLDDSPESIILESVLEGVSEYYSKNLARETRKGLKEIALKAKFTGGCPPFGFDVDENNNYVTNEREAEAVRKIFDACLNCVGYDQLLIDFDKAGLRTKFGKPFAKTSFNAILKNRKYIGDYIYYPEGTAREKKSQPIVLQGALPQIVDKSVFWEVQKIMESRKHTGRIKAVEPYLLSGILFCGECGAPMNGHRHTKNGKHTYTYECSRNARMKQCDNKAYNRDRLEGLVCSYIRELLSDEAIKEIRAFLVKNLQFISEQREDDILVVKRHLNALERKIGGVIDSLIESPKDKNLHSRLALLSAQKDEAQLELERLEDTTLTEKKLDDYIIKFKDFENLSRKQKQIYVKKLIERVTIYKDGKFKIATTYGKVAAEVGGATQI